MEGMYFSRRSRPFQLGITTLAEALAGRWFRGSDFLRNADARSTRASAAIAIASRIGKQMTSGRDLANRQRIIRNVFTGPYFERSGPSPIVRPIFVQRDERIISSCAANPARCASALWAHIVRSRTVASAASRRPTQWASSWHLASNSAEALRAHSV